ncbi:5-formyltetrahydrofolate cyclo-ligase [Pararhodobacter oceanensis]|uniref:5-formyltetrahydrofolate cyclo-ligase n=1 Tax=Pararhodobacter oceanensis TaxID=2172121 RepID=UPI003A90B7C2
MEIDGQKTAARKLAFAARKTAKSGARDAAAQAQLAAALAPYAQDALAGYMPIRTEVDPLPVMEAHTGQVGVPVIIGAGQPLEFHRWSHGCALVDGPFGAQVPRDGEVITPRVVIVPLVGFDAQGYRLGYGGGFYDRTLALLRAAGPVLALGYAFDAQELSQVPIDQYDQRLDGIVTETGLRRFG